MHPVPSHAFSTAAEAIGATVTAQLPPGALNCPRRLTWERDLAMLTDVQIRAFRPTGQPYRVPDGRGLFIAIAGDGRRSWVFRYKLKGASGSIGLGSYPEVGLKAARALAEQARAQVAAGIKPPGLRAQERAREAGTQATVATLVWAWFCSEQTRWNDRFRREVQSRLEQNVIGPIGDLPAANVTVKILLEQVLARLRGFDPVKGHFRRIDCW
jgi:Arm DNA-binding domain